MNRAELNQKYVRQLAVLGAKMPEDAAECAAEERIENWILELSGFIKSYDFMRLGQAVIRGQWQAAAMTIRRMDMQAKKLGADCFFRQFAGLKQTVARKNVLETKQILVSVTAKRVRIMEMLNERARLIRDT